jgi:hypothetical protein
MLNWAKTIHPLSSYIKPQITPPSPLKSATCTGGFFRRIFLADFAPPRGKPATKTRRLTGTTYIVFLAISPNLHDIWPLFLLIPSRY